MKEAPFFELVSKYKGCNELLPQRETKYSAGYDLKAAEDVFLKESVCTRLAKKRAERFLSGMQEINLEVEERDKND